jgi:hypothetical protein
MCACCRNHGISIDARGQNPISKGMSRLVLALMLAAAAAPALAQVAGPTPGQIVAQQQANQNQFQAQLQANQLQDLQRQNRANVLQPDPNLQAQAAARQQQIQQQIDQNAALQQQMSTPSANPNDVKARLQQNGAEIQHLQQTPLPNP